MNKADFIKFDKVKEFYRGLVVLKVKSIIAETILNEKISALEIATKLEEISDKSKDKLDEAFERYGFTVSNFYVQSINFPDEDFEKINNMLSNKAEFEIMGDARYTTKRSFDVYESAANNQTGVAGAFVAGGVGLGAGMNLASNLNNPHLEPTGVAKRKCPKCGNMVGAEVKFCNECGSMIDVPKINCPNCGTENSEGSKFCIGCGADLQGSVCECGTKLQAGAKFCPTCGKKVE